MPSTARTPPLKSRTSPSHLDAVLARRSRGSQRRPRPRSAGRPGAAMGEGSTRSSRAGICGSHQFQRPNSDTTAGTSSARITVASSRMPAASPVASTLTSVSGPEASETNARNRISAALVTSRPVRPMPRTTAVSVEPVASYSSRMRDEDEHLVVHRQPEQEREHHQRDPRGDRAGRGDPPDQARAVAVLPHERRARPTRRRR